MRFLSYLLVALQTLDPRLGVTALALLHSPQPAPTEMVLTLLANDLARCEGEDFALVLDDYHVITDPSLHQHVMFLLEHLPPHMHLILATRADPPLPLSRLRARGHLVEVRADDLRFETEEVRAFLHTVMGLDLSSEVIASLAHRTEGWIAGLQLAALALQGKADVSDFVTAFHGSHRFILDYLSSEVLSRQSAQVQDFLLHTSILNQFQEAEARLQAAEHCLDAEMPPEQARFIRGYVAAIRGNMARYRGDLARSVALSQMALALLPEEEVSPRPIARVNAAHSFLVSGDVTAQQERFTQEMVASQRASANLSMIMRSFTTMARLQITQGRPRQAAKTFEEAVRAVPGQEDLRTTVGSPAYYFGLADILREWNEMSMAERLLEQGMELVNGGFTVDAEVVTLGYTTLARLQMARAEYNQALITLDTFTHLADARSFAPYLLARGMAVRAQVELVQGDLRAATRWTEQSGISTGDENLDYPREQEYLTLARVDIVQGRDDPAGPFLRGALHLLDRLLRDAEAKERMGSALEILILL